MVKDGYKETEIGVIPDDWGVRKIGDFTNAIAGGTPSTYRQEYWNGNIPWMSSGELNKRRIYDVLGRITTLGYNNSSTHLVPRGCVLMGLAGQGKTRGTVAVNYIELCTNQSIAAIFPSNEHSTEFLYQNLGSRYEELRELSSGDGGRGGLNLSIIKNLYCPFPELEEQQKIAEALSDMDNLISSLEKLIEKKNAIKQACLQKMFPKDGETVPEMRLPGFTKPWEQRKLGEVGKCQSGIGFPDVEQGGKTGTPFYKVSDMNNYGNEQEMTCANNYVTDEQIARKNWKPITEVPAVIFAKVGAAIMLNRKRLCRFPFLLDNNTMAYKFGEKWDTNFGKTLFEKIDLTDLVQVGALPSYNATDVENLDIKMPTDINEQKEIGEFFHNLDNLITLHQRKLEKCRKIKEGMMQQLLTGKIRLALNGNTVADKNEVDTVKVSSRGHNHQFDDAVVIAGIVDKFYSDKYPLGRKKVQKLLYLFRRHQEADTSAFKKKATGPYADEVRYKGGEPIAVSNKYICVKRSSKGSSFSKGEKISDALIYLVNWDLNDDLKWLCEQFKYTKTDRLELLATIDMAMCDLTDAGITATVENIKNLIKSHSEWKAKLSKNYFRDNDIVWAIKECRRLFG